MPTGSGRLVELDDLDLDAELETASSSSSGARAWSSDLSQSRLDIVIARPDDPRTTRRRTVAITAHGPRWRTCCGRGGDGVILAFDTSSALTSVAVVGR